MTSYLLAARCRKERRTISRGSVSSHRDYGERMPLSFNNEIQSGGVVEERQWLEERGG